MFQSQNHVQLNHIPQHSNGHAIHHTHQNGGHHQHTLNPNPSSNHPQSHRHPPSNHPPKEPTRVMATPSIHVQDDQLIYGDAQSTSERSYTPIKVVGDGSFGTVLLVDWHSTLPPNTPLSPMQCGAGARPEWAGKRLVALKRMKKRWEGGWDECKKLKELESLRAIPFHPNIIPLYDFFLLPTTKELYFVFEPMEGNLYQLIKSRKGRPLAGGLVSCIFRQVVAGLHHIHEHGYFHRDMKPENLLVTTTGLYDYRNVSPYALPGAPPEKDVVVIVKLADFGLARETKSKPPYTEYVSTRWYRAPEVLLRSRDYSNPVDMWALGTIMSELINLKPLFPGQTELDQIARICEVLGDPSDEYGVDRRGVSIGGGKWVKGIKMARSVRYEFPKLHPKSVHSFFDRNVPMSMIECISDLLKYDPDMRLTSLQCLNHPYIEETCPGNMPPGPSTTPPGPPQGRQATSIRVAQSTSSNSSMNAISPRSIPPSHSNSPANIRPVFNGIVSPLQPQPQHPHRVPFYPQVGSNQSPGQSQSPSLMVQTMSPTPDLLDAMQIQSEGSHSSHNTTLQTHQTLASSVYTNGADRISNGWSDGSTQINHEWDPMDVSSSPPPPERNMSISPAQPMEIAYTPLPPQDMLSKSLPSQDHNVHASPSSSVSHGPSGSGLRIFGKKRSKWHIGGMFGHGDKAQQNVLPPVDELNATSPSTPSLKRTQSSSTDSRSLSEMSPVAGPGERDRVSEPAASSAASTSAAPMDAKSKKKEADKIALEAELQRRAQAEKRAREASRIVMQKRNQVLKQNRLADIEWEMSNTSTMLGVSRPKQKPRTSGVQNNGSSATVNAAGGSFRGTTSNERSGGPDYDNWRETEHRTKARRRDFDDDHSMSSSEVQSVGRISVISFASAESDLSSNRLQHRPSMFGIKPISRMHSTSSLRTSFGDDYSLSARSSNSPSFETQLVNDFDSRASFSSFEHARSSLSETSTSSPPPLHTLSLSSPQQSMQMLGRQPFITLPPPVPSLQVSTPNSSYEYGPYGQIQAQPPSPAIAPHSAINPIFKVPPLTSHHDDHKLPSFSQLAAVAEPLPALHPTEDS